MSESRIDFLENPLSACCKEDTYQKGSRVFCSGCHKTCDLVVTCQRCKGTGEYYNGFEMNGCDCENGYIYLED